MKHKRILFAWMGLMIMLITGCAKQDDRPVLRGPYLGQKPPGMTPELFATGIITTEFHEHSSPVFSPDGKEVYWSVFINFWGPQVILTMRQENDRWTRPEVTPFSGQYSDGNPCFSPDGRKIFFESRRPVHAGYPYTGETDLWVVERTDTGWGEPEHLGWTVNSDKWERGPCISANGNLYFTSNRVQYDDPTGNNDIFVSEFVDGEYKEPRGLGPVINTSDARDSFPFIAPDESYIIFSRDSRRFDTEGNITSGDRRLMISFKDEDGAWQDALEMGPHFYKTRFPSVSPDGKYLFFTKYTQGSNEDFYWVDAKIIKELKPDELK